MRKSEVETVRRSSLRVITLVSSNFSERKSRICCRPPVGHRLWVELLGIDPCLAAQLSVELRPLFVLHDARAELEDRDVPPVGPQGSGVVRRHAVSTMLSAGSLSKWPGASFGVRRRAEVSK